MFCVVGRQGLTLLYRLLILRECSCQRTLGHRPCFAVSVAHRPLRPCHDTSWNGNVGPIADREGGAARNRLLTRSHVAATRETEGLWLQAKASQVATDERVDAGGSSVWPQACVFCSCSGRKSAPPAPAVTNVLRSNRTSAHGWRIPCLLQEREAAGSDGELEAASDAEAPVDTTLRQAPAWVDEDDGRINVDVVAEPRLRKLRATEEEEELDGGEFTQRLRQQFEKVHKRPGWADVLEQREPTAAEQLLMSSAKLVGGKSKFIPRSVLEVTRAKDANAAACSKAVVQAVQFHPTAPAVLTAGLDKTVRLFQVRPFTPNAHARSCWRATSSCAHPAPPSPWYRWTGRTTR